MKKQKVYYVSAHSEIPELGATPNNKYIEHVPKDIYIIMKVKCGVSSYVKDTSFENRWLSSANGTNRLREFIATGANTFYNGQKQRIFRPGQKGPFNHLLQFANSEPSKRETFFLGIKKAPFNVQRLQNDAAKRMLGIKKGVLIEAFRAVEPRYAKEMKEKNTIFVTADQLEPMSAANIIAEIKFMLNAIVGTLDIVPEQLELILEKPWYLQQFMDRRIPVKTIISGSHRISEIIKTGPGIYIIDACREYTGPRLGRANRLVPVGTTKRPRNNTVENMREEEKKIKRSRYMELLEESNNENENKKPVVNI